MLGKLLKYEIPAVGRKLAPMYLAWLAASVLLGVTTGRFDGSNGFMIIPALVYFAVTVAVFVMAIVLIIQRYYNSLFGEEAYFYQALPVSAGEHILSKAITALVWAVLTMLAALVSGIIVLLLMSGTQAFWNGEPVTFSWADFWNSYSSDFRLAQSIIVAIEFLIACIFSFVKSTLAIYAAISIGHIARDHVVLASIGAYIGLLVFESSIGNILISIGAVTTGNIDFNVTLGSSFAATQTLLAIAIAASIGLSTVYFFICKYFMERKLNLA